MTAKSKIKLAVTLIVATNFIPYEIAWSHGDSNPRAVAMGGAFTALGRGYEAPNWNPANLGLSDLGGSSLNVFEIGFRVRNNSFTLADYNRYTGQFLDDSDKDRILESIPSDGLRLDLAAEASALNFSMKGLAFSYKVHGNSSFTIDKDPIKLLFFGNAVVRDVSLSDTKGEGFVLGDMAISYGQAVKRWSGGELAVGASLHYLEGLLYEKVIDTEGGVTTTDSGFVGSGQMIVRSSRGGTGFSTDLGLALRFRGDWYFSAAWQNMISRIAWNTNNEDLHLRFDMKPVTLEDLSQDDSDTLVTTSDTSRAIGDFSTRPAPQLRFGLAQKHRNYTWSLDLEQNMFDGPGHSLNPRLSSGFEYKALDFLPLRVGIGFGGGQGSTYSAGFGLMFGNYRFDFGIANSGTPTPDRSKGLRIAIGMGLFF